MTGAEAMAACLASEGVTTVFGYPGAAIAPFYDALAGAPDIRHVLTCSEQGAGHAASGFARATGKPGVCVATSGPGATNLFTAIATAYSDSIPMVAITGQVATRMLGRDVFQEVDTTGAAEPFTKHAYLLKSAPDIGRVFKEAFHIASTGRKGPVLVDVPVDVQSAELADGFLYPGAVDIRGYKPRHSGHALQVKRVAEAIRSSVRPLLCLGGGLFLSDRGAPAAARAFCERARMPAVTTLMGVGVLPPWHPLNYGMIGNCGFAAANAALAKCDLLIIIGARVGDRAIGSLGDVAVVHVDIDSAEIGKNVGTAVPLVGDAGRVIEQLTEQMERMGMLGSEDEGLDARDERTAEVRREWGALLDGLRAGEGRERAERRAQSPSARALGLHGCGCGCGCGCVEPARFLGELSSMLGDGDVYVADVGQNQIWSAHSFNSAARFITTGGMGTMGYSIPAAVGAKVARPGKTAVAVCGDGAFAMSMGELGTVAREGLAVKIVVMANGKLGMVREIQDKTYSRPYAVSLGKGAPDAVAIARAFGIPGARARSTDEAVAAAREMLGANGPFVLECAVDPSEPTL